MHIMPGHSATRQRPRHLDRSLALSSWCLLALLDLLNQIPHALLAPDLVDALLEPLQLLELLGEDVAVKVEVGVRIRREGQLDRRAELGRVGRGERDPRAVRAGVSWRSRS